MVGTPAGHAIVPGALIVGVMDATAPAGAAAVAVVLLVSDAPVRLVVPPDAELPTDVTAWVWVITPLNELIVVPLMVGTPTGQAIAGGVHAFPVNEGALFVPAGVPALTALLTTLSPVNDGAEFVPLGVRVSLPPVVPTSAFAATVPTSVFPLSAVISVKPVGQTPLSISRTDPAGTAAPCPLKVVQTGGV